MKKTAAMLLALSVLLTLCGCCLKHEWKEATCTEPKTCVRCGETEGEALGHKWTEATYHNPRTCTVCGETAGERLQTFYEKNGIRIREKPETFYPNTMYAASRKNPKTVRIEKAVYSFESYTVRPSASRAGYKTVILRISARSPQVRNTERAIVLGDLYDMYTGYRFAGRGVDGDDVIEYYDTAKIGGKSVTIYYTETVDFGKAEKSSSDGKYYYMDEMSYYIEIPVDYDGLILEFDYFTEDDWGEDDFDQMKYGINMNPDRNAFYFRIGN